MADLSKITLPDNTQVTLKDNSQVLSDHRHHESDLVPIIHKKYESTDYYAITAGSWETSTWYFASIKPDSWYLPWKAKFKIHTYCPNYATHESLTYSMVSGRADSLSYCNWNEVNTTAHYYIAWYPLKAAGFNNGYGHAFGISIYNASSYTSPSYYRTFEIDFIECENCTVTILDNPVKWSSWSGTGSTNYNGIVSGNASSRGLQETGDIDTSTHNRVAYFGGKTGAKGIWAASLFMEDVNGTYENICTASDGTVTSSNRTTATTKKANTTGFKALGTIWYTNTTYAANTNISGSGVVYSAYGIFDSRYAFNTTLTANSLTPYKEVYLVGTIYDDGLFYLDSTWWTQTPNDPTKVYVLVGACFDSTTSYCRATLYEQNKWYKYDGTKLVEISGDALSVNGHTVETDVPSGAVFTDTTYTGTGVISVNATTHVISSTAEVNQNAFSNVKVGSSTIQADDKTDTLELAAGSNVTLTPDTTNDKVTIAATDTTYTFANGTNGFTVTPSGGTAQTVTVTPSIANNITGTGTSGYLTKFNGTNTVTNGPQLGSDTTKFLRNDGTWQVPPNNNTVPSAYCETAAATATKVATCTNYTATANTYIHILFRYANTAKSALTLNINSTGAKLIYINDVPSSSVRYTLPAGTYIAYYDGRYYYIRTDGIIPGTIEKVDRLSKYINLGQQGDYLRGAGIASNVTYNPFEPAEIYTHLDAYDADDNYNKSKRSFMSTLGIGVRVDTSINEPYEYREDTFKLDNNDNNFRLSMHTYYENEDVGSELESKILSVTSSVDSQGVITHTIDNDCLVSTTVDNKISTALSDVDASTVNGHTVDKDVPSNAVFTDTKYTFANGDDSFTVTPSGSSAQTVKVNSYHLKNTDNRSDNQLPSWYMTNHPRSTIQEFKSCSAIGVNSLISTAYCILTTIIPWTDTSGGGPVQIATSNAGVRAQRVSLDASTWGSWVALPNSDTTYTLSADGASVKLTPSSGSATTASLNSLISGLPVGTSDAQGADYLVAQSAGGGSSDTTYYRRPVNKVVNGTVVKAALGTDGSTSTQFLNKKGAWSTIQLSSGTITIDNGSITPLTATSNLKEAYLTWGGKNFSGTYGCLDAAMVPELGANRFMYYTASGITIEYTRDGGTTWQDYGATDAQKVGLFSVGQAFYIGKADSTDKATAHGTDYQLRVTLSTYGILYTQLNKFIMYVSTAGSAQPKVTIQKAKGNAPDTFEEVATDIPINGWSGYNVINVDPFTTYGNTIGSQYGYIRFIFTANGGDTNYIGLSVSKILGFGGAGWTTPTDMAKTGHLYSYDVNKNATFPGGMTIKGDVLISKDRKTDSLMFNGYNDAKVGMRLSETGKNMDLGWDWNSYAGSGAYFRAATHSNAGRFGFYARSSSGTVQLIGDTNGALTWNSKRVVTATNGTQIGGPTTPVYVTSSGYVTACSLSTRNIFVETVTTPYNVGDLWLGSDGTFQCITAKASGEFDIEDWEEIPNGYLDTEEVMALINQNTQIVTSNGSILWHDGNNDGKYDEILLIRNDATADPVTLSNATSVYKFYNGGLYYSSTGYNGTYSTILTPDGKGVADFLQYGTLDASKVNIINFNSSMITAGLLKRGGTNNDFGEVEVYNASGVLIGKIDNAGFTFYGAGQVGQRPYIKINDAVGFAGYDAADNIVFQVVGDEFRAKKMIVSDEISVGGKLKFLPITIMEGSTVVNDGVAFVGLV